jgi:signal transduction histidine kinase
MTATSVRFAKALWWSGACAWIGVSIATIVRAQSLERLAVWSLASIVFFVSFSILQRVRHEWRWLLGVQSVAIVAMVAVLCNGYEGFLLVLVAAQLGRQRWPVGLTWIFVQTGAMSAGIAYEWTARSALLLTPPYLGFQLLMYAMARLLVEERNMREQVEAANLQLLELQKQLAQTTRLDERMRITQDLHDVFGHRLTALSLNLEAVGQEVAGAAREAIGSAQSLVRLLLDDVKALVLASKDDVPVDLARELRELARDLPSPHIHLDSPPDLRFDDPRAGRALLRCAQEFVTNSIRHGTAANVWIRIAFDGDQVSLVARDDGSGAFSIRDGFGISGMRRRMQELGGALTVDGLVPGRFEVRAVLPIGPDRST